ncbi:MAG: FHA domain-containing protein [Acidobacteria bacterium]|nr:FHA domain-containing protein [Acidobacteriota bacterium]
MEQFLRRLLEKIGAEADSLIGKSVRGLAPESLIPALYQAIELNLAEDKQGVRRVAPGQISLALNYEVHSRVEAETREAVRQELRDTVLSYIHDHRYGLESALVLEIECDPFLRKPFEVRVSRGPSATEVKERWLEARDGRKIMLRFGEPGEHRRLTVGRIKDNDIIIDDPTVSRFHASMTLNQCGEITVSDLGSANGTYINDLRVESSAVLRRGDELTIGSVSFTLMEG